MKTIGILEACNLINKDCDGAHEKDGVGFNKPDSMFFKSILRRLEYNEYPEMDTLQTLHMRIQKYKQQLADYGYELENITLPTSEEHRALYNQFRAKKEAIRKEALQKSKKVTFSGKFIEIMFNYDSELVNKVKEIDGRRFDYNTKKWFFILTSKNIGQLEKFVKEEKFEVSPLVIDEIEKMRNSMEDDLNYELIKNTNLELSSATESDYQITDRIKGILRPYQKAGVRYIIQNKRVLLGDEMGLGKTLQSIASIEQIEAFPALILCPNSLKYNWRNEFLKFTDRTKIQVVEPKTQEIELNQEVIIINYENLSKFSPQLQSKYQFKAIVADESHKLKNKNTIRATLTKGLVSKSKDLKLCLLLTGTPIDNHPIELTNQLEILGQLKRFGGFWGFASKYCNPIKEAYGYNFGIGDLNKLHNDMREVCYLRREKKNVLKELPPKQFQDISLTLDKKSKYHLAQSNFKAFLLQSTIEQYGEAKNKKELLEIIDKKIDKITRAEIISKIALLRKEVGLAKVPEVIEFTKNILEDINEKVLIFVAHKETADKISKELGFYSITGEVKAKERQDIVDRFQTDPKQRGLVLNIKAGGVGLNLTSAANVIVAEYPWTPSEYNQAIDRAHRIGQENSVMVYNFTAQDSIDTYLRLILSGKTKITDAVNAGVDFDETGIEDLSAAKMFVLSLLGM